MKGITLLLVVCLVGQAFCSPDDLREREGRIFAYYSTTSQTSLTTTTITAIYTCLSTTTTACLGRKRRMNIGNADMAVSDLDDMLDLDGSIPSDEANALNPGVREAKKLTIWSTAFTTLTITSTSLLAGTTVSASALCAATGVTAGCFIG